jgi:UrcA family protein
LTLYRFVSVTQLPRPWSLIPKQEANVTKFLLMMSAVALSSTAIAAPTPAASSTVSYADLDLSSSAGVDQLQARINHAAQRLCVEDGVKPVADQQRERACVAGAVSGALAQVHRVIAARSAGVAAATSAIAVKVK